MFFDGYGNMIDSGNQGETDTTVLGYDIPEDISSYGVATEYAQALKTTINNWMSEYAGSPRKVPFIVHTDQHGRLNANIKGLFDLLSQLVNWEEISAIFNLGDTVTDHWSDDATHSNPILRNAELENAIKCISSCPKTKQINVWGNHDTWYSGALTQPVAGVLPTFDTLNPYFQESGLRTVRCPDNSNMKVVYDDKYKIKYVVVSSWDYGDKQSGNTGYQWYWISKAHWEWIINELKRDEGYDIVIVSHVPLCIGSERAIDPITMESITKTTPTRLIHYSPSYDKIWADRKNKASGTISVNNETVSYDFTNCSDNCLCAIAGHTHYNGVDYLQDENGLLQVAFNWFDSRTIHFGIIDRENNRINVWQLSNKTGSPVTSNWQAPFNKSVN